MIPKILFKFAYVALGLMPVFWTTQACLKQKSRESLSETKGFVTSKPDQLWPTSSDQKQVNHLEVCWDRSQGLSFADAEKRIENYLTEKLKITGFLLTGWADCPLDPNPNVKPIRWDLEMETYLGHAGGVGFDRDRHQKPMVLAVKGEQSCPNASNYLQSNCILNIALHEMGHVFGLHHELSRLDIKDEDYCKKKELFGDSETIQIGSPDRYSIMNYCRLFEGNRENRLVPLSFGDIVTLKTLYKGPMAYIELPLEGDQEYRVQKFVSLENLPIQIAGKNLKDYQFTWARVGQKCHETGKAWSSWRPLEKGINLADLPLPLDKYLYKPLKLCVVGRTSDQEQSRVVASSLVLTFDRGESIFSRFP